MEISTMYTPFRDRKIVFENDIYDNIEKENKQLIKMCKEQNLFCMEKK